MPSTLVARLTRGSNQCYSQRSPWLVTLCVRPQYTQCASVSDGSRSTTRSGIFFASRIATPDGSFPRSSWARRAGVRLGSALCSCGCGRPAHLPPRTRCRATLDPRPWSPRPRRRVRWLCAPAGGSELEVDLHLCHFSRKCMLHFHPKIDNLIPYVPMKECHEGVPQRLLGIRKGA